MKLYNPSIALQSMDIGKSVAEQDDELDRYFIETQAFQSLVEGKIDIIAGDKGTGKSAIYRMLNKKKSDYPELDGIVLISAFNPTGNPAFQRLAQGEAYSEGVYRTIWKAYFLSLAGRWLLDTYGDAYNSEVANISRILEALAGC